VKAVPNKRRSLMPGWSPATTKAVPLCRAEGRPLQKPSWLSLDTLRGSDQRSRSV